MEDIPPGQFVRFIGGEPFVLEPKPITRKREYENKKGLTEPQRILLNAITSKKGNFLQEVTRLNGRKMFRCYDREKRMIMPTPDFHKVIVRNLVSKGLLVSRNGKYFLK